MDNMDVKLIFVIYIFNTKTKRYLIIKNNTCS